MLHHFQKLLKHLSDRHLEELIKKAVRKDPNAFGKLYMHHIDAVYRFTLFRINNRDDVEDITQSIFFKAWERIDTFSGKPGQFKAWLFTIARNTIIDFYRSKKNNVQLPENILDAKSKPEDELILACLADDFRKSLRSLTGIQREVVLLRLVEGISYDEIATIVGKREDAVRAIYHRGRTTLRKMLKHHEE